MILRKPLHSDVRGLPGPANDAGIPGCVTLSLFAAAFFTLTMLTDWAYTRTTVLMWKDFSSWLLFAGLVAGGVAVLIWLVGLVIQPRRPVWTSVLLRGLVLLLALVNSLFHAGDGWTAIVPWGFGLSVLTVVLMLLVAAREQGAFHPFQRA